MIAPLRRQHRFMVFSLAGFVAIVFFLALWFRPAGGI